MQSRFLESIADIPEIDKTDILQESPIFNPFGIKLH